MFWFVPPGRSLVTGCSLVPLPYTFEVYYEKLFNVLNRLPLLCGAQCAVSDSFFSFFLFNKWIPISVHFLRDQRYPTCFRNAFHTKNYDIWRSINIASKKKPRKQLRLTLVTQFYYFFVVLLRDLVYLEICIRFIGTFVRFDVKLSHIISVWYCSVWLPVVKTRRVFRIPAGLWCVWSQRFPDASPRPSSRVRVVWRWRCAGGAALASAVSHRADDWRNKALLECWCMHSTMVCVTVCFIPSGFGPVWNCTSADAYCTDEGVIKLCLSAICGVSAFSPKPELTE